MEKSRRKIEGDLRVSQEAVAELERNKAELAQSVQRKEREFSAIMAKIEDEASLGTKQQKQIKELTVSNTFNLPFGLMPQSHVSKSYSIGQIELPRYEVIYLMRLCLRAYVSSIPKRNFTLWGSFESLSYEL